MMDDVDRAQEINDLHLGIALKNQRAAANIASPTSRGTHLRAAGALRARPGGMSPHHDGVEIDECLDCGGRIPEARQAAVPGCTRCIDCQEKFETGRNLIGDPEL